jgi:threonine dehydrogenase-like Zn-dependent dehydrogenase
MLPGDSTVKFKEFDFPSPDRAGAGEDDGFHHLRVDIRAIYREHTGKGRRGTIDGMDRRGHEPCGQIVEEGRASCGQKGRPRDRVPHPPAARVPRLRMGYQISSPVRTARLRWQRDGGMAVYICATSATWFFCRTS